MTPEQQAAYINSQVACMLAELEAMKARNAHTASLGLAQVYSEQDFLALPDKHGIGHNAVVGLFKLEADNRRLRDAVEQALWHWGADADRKAVLDAGKGWATDTFACLDMLRKAKANTHDV